MKAPRYERPPLSLIEENVHPFGVSIYIGGVEGTSDLALLKANEISTVVNCAVNLDFNFVPTNQVSSDGLAIPYGPGAIRYYKIGLVDGPGNPASMLLAGYYILRGALIQEMPEKPSYPNRRKGNVLVNCRAGRSRSVALTALFLHRSMPSIYPSIDLALERVRDRRELRPDEWFETPKQVLIDAVEKASGWIDMIGDDMPQSSAAPAGDTGVVTNHG